MNKRVGKILSRKPEKSAGEADYFLKKSDMNTG